MFDKFFNRFRKENNNDTMPDLSLGYARTAEFRRYLTGGKYTRFEKEFNALAWDARTLLVDGIGLSEGDAPLIQKWVQANKSSANANLFAGVSKTCLAWIARTGAVAAEVTDDRTNAFFDLLNEAYDYLHEADALNPADPEICARTVRVLMGLGGDKEAAYSYFDAAAGLVPAHLSSHLMMINYLAPKWYGTIEKMYEFADTRYAAAGNSLLIVLPLFCLAEENLYYSLMNETEKEAAFFADETRKRYILDLYKGYRRNEEGKLLIPYVYNYFAYLFYQIGEHERAKDLIRGLNGKMVPVPWAYLGIHNNRQLQALYADV